MIGKAVEAIVILKDCNQGDKTVKVLVLVVVGFFLHFLTFLSQNKNNYNPEPDLYYGRSKNLGKLFYFEEVLEF